jgi:hypothetical protein
VLALKEGKPPFYKYFLILSFLKLANVSLLVFN